MVVWLIRHFPPLRFLGHVCTAATYVVAIKRP